ncbi:MAG: SH3 domain-containing protein [Selenomonadaceae bacterium]|nr:SH3 domain-containing protein [Selenomonadaceae bacterium]
MKLQIIFTLAVLIFFIGTKSSYAAGIEITDARATPEYWIDRNADGDELLFTYRQIENINAEILKRDNYSADLKNYPETISAKDLKKRIEKLTDDVNLESSWAVRANRNLNALNQAVNVRYAVTTERVNIRLLPQPPTGDKYDSVQGTALDPAEAVAVLWESKDGKFSFIQARYYFGWVNKNSLAFTDRDTWLTYLEPENFLVVTTNKKFVRVNDKLILFQMGAKIPLENLEVENNLWTARLPIIENGELQEISAQVLNDDKVSTEFLPCTTNNFIRQSFKFLGDIYGWGGLDNSVDCSAFVQNVYRSMGINIPRDADKQEGCMPIFAVFNNVTTAERLDIVSRAPTGALLFKPGHVMLKLGNDDSGKPIIIHAASSYYSYGEKIYVRKVLVSDTSYQNYSGTPTLESLTGIAFPR